MPICNQIQINNSCRLIVWKTSEPLEELLQIVRLTPNEEAKLNSFGSQSRKIEFAATRCLLQLCLGENVQIKNDEHGKPHLINSDLNISISHTKSYVGILIGDKHSVALDMEYLSDRVNRIACRFLSETELNNIEEENKILHLYQHWCAKECLIKMYGKKDVHLIDELKISPFSPGDSTFSGQVYRTDFSKTYTFHYLLFDNHLLVYSTKRNQQ
ncbi:4'-phosphopantetheinyl transferase superfamily protein [Labilibaculum sp. K2S]|uniref:4'-phosphopantetheinyl transferase family protein n=1 Tax=Labilibaculum sp. K2S TaxID=3056386 RepID=UPI0025A40EB6|nr:4'-phosphopantetheinyl transferase superfamily protein [Labilibaculum sp. K2S]MDM8158881.1 4'-phosphopantetheinyl transferase superfamily protein [Labilibaculum sp. K2S]